MSATLLRPLGFGEILDGAFAVYRRHFVALFATSLVAHVPLSLAAGLWVQATVRAGPDGLDASAALAGLLFVVVNVAMWVLVSAALTRQMAAAVTGGDVSVGDGYAHAARRFLPLALAGVLVLLTAIAVLFGVVLVMAVAAGITAAVLTLAMGIGPGAVGAAAAVVFAVAGGMTMLLTFAVFFAVPPVVVFERRGPAAALGRSWRLVRGARWRIAGVLLVSSLIVTLPAIGLAIAGLGPDLLAMDAAASLSSGRFVLQQVLGMFAGALTFPFFIGCMTLVYFDRRVRTEAYDVEVAAEALPSAG